MSRLLGEAYKLIDNLAADLDNHGDHPMRDDMEEWLKSYEKQDVEQEEAIDRIRRIETRLCILMEHFGLSGRIYNKPS
jgi:hypothetical protein